MVGDASLGRAGEGIYINTATGNLVIQHEDELLKGIGPDSSLLRTYNSLGARTDDNGDNWQFNAYKSVGTLTGAINTAGSTVVRTDGDGTRRIFTFDSQRGLYVNKDNAGAFDTLNYANNAWTWMQGATRMTESYDWNGSVGKMVAMADADGNKLTYQYTGNLITAVTSASGETTYLDYVGNKLMDLRIVRSDGAEWTRVRYEYDASNRLSKMTIDLSPSDNSIADGKTFVTTYSYVGASTQLAGISESDGSSIVFNNYDAAGRITQLTQTVGGVARVTKLTYESGQTTVTDPLGNTTIYSYDAAGRLTTLSGSAIDGTTRQVFKYAYNSNGHLATQTDGNGNGITYDYDANGNRIFQRDDLGNTVARVFGARNELLSESVYPVAGGAALTTRYAYDGNGHLRFIVTAEGRVTEYRYNSRGQRTDAIDYIDSRYTGSAFDAASLAAWVSALADKSRSLRIETVYDARGQVARETRWANVDANGNGITDGKQSVMMYFHDQAGLLFKKFNLDNGTTYNYTYDGMGRVLTATDALGNITLTKYDDANNKTVVTLANGLATTYAYDAAGELLSVVQANGATALGTTSYAYDKNGRLCMKQDPTGVKQYCLYDEAGRKVAEVDGTGSLIEYVYDANNNLVRQVRYNTPVSSANLTALSNASGIGIKLSTIRPAAMSNTLNRSTWNLYDAAGRLVKTIDELGYVTETQYDGANRMTAVIRYAKPVDAANITNTTRPADAAATPAIDAVNDRRTRYFYDADGKLLGTLDAEGTLSENIYDGAGRLQHTIAYAKRPSNTLWASGTLAQLRPASSTQDLHYWKFHDGQSQVIAEVDGEGAVVEYFYNANGNRVQQTSYVNRSRIAPNAITTSTLLASVRPVADARDAISRWTYTGADQVQTYTRPEGSVTKYAYDAIGNLTRTDHALGTSNQRTLQARYDVQGRVVAELSGVGSAALAQLNAPTQAQIDAIWNQYSARYAYDAAGRKISVIDPNGNKTLYYYDADGQPIYTINAAGEVTQNTWDALSNLTQVRRYGARLSATAMAALAGGLVTPAVTNTISALANAAVDSVVSYAYDVRGEVVTKSDTIANVSYAYNAFGETTTATTAINSSGSTATQTTYDRRGLVTQVVEDSGTGGIQRKTGYAYDSFGNKTARIDANGNLTRYFYDRDNRLKYTLDALGGVVRMDYDTEGRIIKKVAYATALKGIPTSALISDIESKLVLDPAHDSVLNQLYDKDGRLVFTVSGTGTVTHYSYDARGNVTRAQAYAKSLTAGTALTFDAVSTVVQASGFSSAADAVTRSAYDADNRLIWQADATGAVSTWKYDNAGNLIEEIGYVNRLANPAAAAGSLPTVDLARDRHVRRVYDAANREIAFAVAQKTDAANNLQWTVTKKVLDTQGRVIQQTVGANHLSSQTLAAQPTQAQVATWINSLAATTLDAVERYAYDVAGRLVYKVDAVNTVTQFSYDQTSNLTQKRTYATAVTLSNGVLTQSQIATALTNKTSAVDQLANFVYDALGRVIYTIDASGYAAKNTYDAFGNVVLVRSYAKAIALPSSPSVASVDAAVANAYTGDSAAAAADHLEGRVYDADNRLLYKIDGQGYVTGTTYDGLGRIASTTRYATQLASSFITNASQLKPVIYATALATPSGAQQNDRTDTFAYDAAGNLIESRDPMGGVERFTYDALGRKLSFTNKLGKTWNYQYDTAGRLMLEIAPAVAVAQGSWTTDANGNATYSALPSASIALQTKIDYDAFGNVKARTEAYGTSQQRTTSYDYDAVGRQVKITYPPVDVYNAAADTARTTTMTEVVQKGVTPTDTVIYDALGNAVVHTDAAGNNSYKVYDNAGRVRYEVDAKGADGKGFITGYARDGYGQVTALTRYGVGMSIASQGAKPLTLASVQAFVTASTTSHATDRVVTTQYDTLGHVIKVIEPQAEVWDSYGTNGSYFTAGKTTETTYNAFGEALKVSVYGQNASGTRVTAAADTYYSWSNLGQKVAEFNSADATVTTSSNWSATGYLTRMDYDAAGNLKTRTEYSAALTITDSAWNAVTGLAMPAAKAAAQDSPNRVTAYAYDLNGRLTEETRKNVAYMSVDGTTVTSDLKTRYGYDAVGNRTSVTDALGNTTYTYYDALGRVVAVASPPTARQRAQIAQIYLALLGRAPEAAGLIYWVGRLQSGASMLQVAREIYGSAEAQGVFAGVSDNAFLTALYKGLFTGEPDSSWVSLRSSALSKDVKAGKAVGDARAQAAVSIIEDTVALAGSDAAVMNSKVSASLSFADSGNTDLNVARSTANSAGVAAGLRVQVAQLYVAILNRSPAAEGLAYWTGRLQSNATRQQIAQEIWKSDEARNLYGTSVSSVEMVTRLYQNIWGQAPDEATKSNLLMQYNAVAGGPNPEGTFIVSLIEGPSGVMKSAGSSGWNQFINRVGAALPESVDTTVTAAPLTEFKLDLFGNAVQRIDYASGALYATQSAYGAQANPGADRETVTKYDSHGHAVITLDAEKHAAFTSYDVLGRVAKQWQVVTDADKNRSVMFRVLRYDAVGQLQEVIDPSSNQAVNGTATAIAQVATGSVTTRFDYNAFGEMTAKTVNNTKVEENRYDNAGHLWLSNSGDGVYKAEMYDLRGRRTVELKSGDLNLSTYASLANLMTKADATKLVRDETRYDLLGRAVESIGPAMGGNELTAAATTALQTGAISVGASTPAVLNFAGTSYSGLKKNATVSLSWSAANLPLLTGLGNGDVLVEVDYSYSKVVNKSATGTGSAQFQTNPPANGTARVTLEAADAVAGATIKIDNENNTVYAVDSITSVRLYKKNINGVYQLLIDQSPGGSTPQWLKLPAPVGADQTPVLLVRPLGAADWLTVDASSLINFGDVVLFDPAKLTGALPAGNPGVYDYRLCFQKAGDPAPTAATAAVASGRVGATNALLRERVTQLYAALLNRSPDQAGLAYWVDQIRLGKSTLVDVANFILGSSEGRAIYTDSVLSSATVFVNKIYQIAFNRTPASTEIAGWITKLSGNVSRAQLVLDILAWTTGYVADSSGSAVTDRNFLVNKTKVGLMFANSGGNNVTEATQVMSKVTASSDTKAAERAAQAPKFRLQVAEMYVALLNRLPDHDGLANAAASLQANTLTLAQFGNNLLASAEAKNRNLYQGLTNAQFINTLFQTAFGRAPTSAEATQWVAKLNANVSRGQVTADLIATIVNYVGADPGMLTAQHLFDNKVVIGLSYAWDTGGNEGTVEIGILPYITAAATAKAAASAAADAMSIEAREAPKAAVAALSTSGITLAAAIAPLEANRTRVVQLYVSLLNRAPQLDGFNWWVNSMPVPATQASLLSTVQGFLGSSEGLSLYPASLTDAQFVTKFYQTAFGRIPTTAESGRWQLQLANKVSRAQTVLDMIDAIVNYDGTDLTQQTSQKLFNNKVAVGMAYAMQMGGSNLANSRNVIAKVTASNISAAMTTAATLVKGEISTLATATANALNKATADLNAANAAVDAASKQANVPLASTATQRYVAITQLYLAILNRNPDLAGFNVQYNAVQNNVSLSQIADNILNSDESKSQYKLANPLWKKDSLGNFEQVDATTFVTNVFRRVLNRVPESGGMKYWTDSLSQGYTRGQVLLSIITAFLGNTKATTADLSKRASFDNRVKSALAALTSQSAGTASGSGIATASSWAQSDYNAASALHQWSVLNDTANATKTTTDGQRYLDAAQLLWPAFNRAPASIDELSFYADLYKAGYTSGQLAQTMLDSSDGLKVYPASLSPSDFVIKVYQVMIGRSVTASDDGVKSWVNQLGSSTRGQVLVNIRNSFLSITDSFQSNKRDYLQKVFNVLNGMKSTAAGMTLDTRMAALNTAAANAAKTADAAAIAAAAGIAPQSALTAMRLYVLLMNKLPSSSTLIAYAKQLSSGQTPAAVAANILASSEGVARYPASLAATSFVATIYQGALGRSPTTAENSQWITALSSKPRGQVAADMVATLTGYSGTDPQILASANLYAGKVNSWLNGVIAATQAALQASSAPFNEIKTIAARTLIDLAPSLPAPDLLADPAAVAAAAAPRTARTFDRWGNVVTVTDPRNAAWVTRYTWNSADQLTSVSGAQVFDAAKNAMVTPATTTGYDALGRQVASKDANGNLTRQVWDASGNLVRTLQADGGIESNRYDALGNRTWHRSAAGTTDEFAYDKLGRLTQVTRAARLGVDQFKTALDSTGQVTLSFDKRDAVTESWSWDELGQRISHTDGAGQTDKTFYDLRGNIVRTVDANQNATRYAFDAWGHKTGQQDADGNLMTWAWNWNAAERRFRQDSHKDLGKATVKYTWNFLNQLKTQTSTGGSHAAQDLVYTYDASSGLLTKIEDRAQIWGNAASPNATKVTQYAYDLSGNRIRERTAMKSNGKEVGVFQDNHLAYDALNRLTDAADERYRMKIEYDANGNRVHVNTTYVADGVKNPTTVDAWNAYDAMNRQTIVDGKKDTATGKIVIDTVKDGGVQLSYDNDGRRIMARQWGLRLKSTTQMTYLRIDRAEDTELLPVVTWGTEAGFVAESYTYDAAGRLADTWRDGIDIDHRQYDAASRVVGSGASGIAAMAAQAASNINLSKALNDAGIATDQKTTRYAAAGRQQNQTLKSLDGSTVTKIGNAYDKSGNLTSAKVEQAGSTVNYTYDYTGGEFDSKKLKTVTVKQSGMTDASTTNSYDALGNLVKTQISRNGKLIQRDFINDANGQALKQVDEQGITRTLIVNDQVQGSTSASGNTFRSGYEPLTDAALSGGPSTYTVQADGQTLQNVAQALWGDASLWYLIADANGLGNVSLTKGQVLVIPAKGSAGGNTYQTFKPYDASKVMGDITPQGMPLPQGGGGGCGGLGQILVVVVAIVATIYTAGALSGASGGFFSTLQAGAGVLAGGAPVAGSIGATYLGGTIGTAAVAGAVGSIVSQGIGMAMGMQDHFSWSGVAYGALGSALTAGVGQMMGGAEKLKGLSDLQKAGELAKRAAIANVMTQGVRILNGKQDHFEWSMTAASAAGAWVGAQAASAIGDTFGNNPMGSIMRGTVSGMAAGATSRLIGGTRASWGDVARDSFGNALGNSLAEMNWGGSQQTEKRVEAQTKSDVVASKYGAKGIIAPPGMEGRPYIESVVFEGGSNYAAQAMVNAEMLPMDSDVSMNSSTAQVGDIRDSAARMLAAQGMSADGYLNNGVYHPGLDDGKLITTANGPAISWMQGRDPLSGDYEAQNSVSLSKGQRNERVSALLQSREDTLRSAGEKYDIDPRSIAAAITWEFTENRRGYTSDQFLPASKQNGYGWGQIHDSTLRNEMNPSIREDQSISLRSNIDTGIDLVGARIRQQADTYQSLTGINLRDNPVASTWLFNTSATSLVRSAQLQLPSISTGLVPTLHIQNDMSAWTAKHLESFNWLTPKNRIVNDGIPYRYDVRHTK